MQKRGGREISDAISHIVETGFAETARKISTSPDISAPGKTSQGKRLRTDRRQ